ncbi:MAG: FAD-binding oxidoreductase, partial [Actinobacteria bacterium]|nr:FAD-binding oxidoreductase [Actinomycetota bacterium]
GVVIDMTRRAAIRRFEPAGGLVRADGGATLDEILRAAVPHGWFLPVTPGTSMITVGGAIAADVHGKNHPTAGSFRHHVRGFTLLLADGTHRWVTPDDDDVFAATFGGMGLTGIVLDAEIALRRIATTQLHTTTIITGDLDATLSVLDAADAEYRIATLDLMRTRNLGRAIVETADHADTGDDNRPPRFAPAARLTVPPGVPGGLLNRASARLANELWFARAARRPRHQLVEAAGFFYPLDAVAHWNRLYGPRGFVQYQVAVPCGAEDAIRAIARRFAQTRCPTFVAVLKRLGRGAGLLSFPIDGWTVAVDIPAGVAELGRLLDDCDEIVCQAEGRVYLAKDGRLSAHRLRRMYPEVDGWRRIRDQLDPHGRWRSDLGRRLGLCT